MAPNLPNKVIDRGPVDRNFKALRESMAAATRVVAARVYNSAAISVVNAGTGTILTFGSERFDTAGLHSTTSLTGRLTAPIAGLYRIDLHGEFAANATGIRQLAIRLNGATLIAAAKVGGAADAVQVSTGAVWSMAAGDYVEARAYQTSGVALDLLANSAYSPEFSMVRLGAAA